MTNAALAQNAPFKTHERSERPRLDKTRVRRETARASDPKTKDELLLLAVNRFCDHETYDRLSISQFQEAFYLLISSVSFSTRQIVARLLAGSDMTPRQVALYFALEDVAIAKPVLLSCSALNQLDFLQISEMKGLSHSRILAKRADIGPSYIQYLHKFDDDAIREALRDNAAVNQAPKTRSADALFTKIASQPVEVTVQTQHEETKQQKIAATESAQDMLLHAAARGKRLDTQTDISANPARVSSNAVDANTETEDHSEVKAHVGDRLERAASLGSDQAFAILLAKALKISLNTCFDVLEDETGDTLCVAMKSLDLDPAQANRILMLLMPSIGLSVQNSMRSVRFYSQLKNASCVTAVEQWKEEATSSAEPKAQNHQPYLANDDRRDTRSLNVETTTKLFGADSKWRRSA
ncbi:MAG: hypothetical protein AAGF28_03820 [Pseudomonadota bacterium]